MTGVVGKNIQAQPDTSHRICIAGTNECVYVLSKNDAQRAFLQVLVDPCSVEYPRTFL